MIKIWINNNTDDVIKLSDAQAYVLASVLENSVVNLHIEDRDKYDFLQFCNRLYEESNIPRWMEKELDEYAKGNILF